MTSKSDSSNKDISQWVAFLPKCEVTGSGEGERPVFIKLRHPKTDKCALFLVGNDGYKIYELLALKEKYRSWFIGDTVQRDGSLRITTSVDPLFLLLPYLIKAAENGMYMTLDQLVDDKQFPQCTRLLKCCEKCDISQVSDCKGSVEFTAYRYSEDKTITWLKAKVEQVATKLEEKSIHVTGGAQSATFVRSSKGNGASKEDYMRYAVGLVGDYLQVPLAQKLAKQLGIEEKVVSPKSSEPAAKKIKLSKDLPEATEDYSKYFTEKSSKTKPSKLSAQQKGLQKVDKSGMKSISSFFRKSTK
ncbi:ribonuclease H2 subunit B-like [Anneissia japonica]|uniref:ribonuclease H2 subunit B-like n=1 Tax=Anneissia japonica TaxID=1529436 RepID=UPI001425A9C5|nr:ribonuclease H2 subunit B-like [Anneissia japonica]